jgi:RNAse (barnase) inhibitor barstar
LVPERSGVYLMPADTATLRRAATGEKLAWMELDAAGVRDKESLLEACAFSFDFPDSFGSNWDALSDCLRDFSWRPASGCVILWHGGATLAEAAPDDFATALEIFRDAATYWKGHARVFVVLLDHAVRGAAVRRFPGS